MISVAVVPVALMRLIDSAIKKPIALTGIVMVVVLPSAMTTAIVPAPLTMIDRVGLAGPDGGTRSVLSLGVTDKTPVIAVASSVVVKKGFICYLLQVAGRVKRIDACRCGAGV